MRHKITLLTLLIFFNIQNLSAKNDDYSEFFASNLDSIVQIDYTDYQQFLDNNLRIINVDNEKVGDVKGFDYQNITADDKALLKQHLLKMQDVPITDYNDDTQLAFWMNLYNVIVLDMILDFYPINSFPDIKVQSNEEVWKMKRVTMMGRQLSLDNIQHDILRKKFSDWRILNALNIATFSSGSWQEQPFTGDAVDIQLEERTKYLFTRPLSASIIDNDDNNEKILRLIAILKWYEQDFLDVGMTLNDLLQKYLPEDLWQEFDDTLEIEYFYDWRLNQIS